MTFEEACMVVNDLRREVERAAEKLYAGGWPEAGATARGVTVDVECILDVVRREYSRAPRSSPAKGGGE